MNKYVHCAMIYGFGRTFSRAVNLKRSDGVTDALPGTKLVTVAVGTAMAPWFLPVYIFNDVNRAAIDYYKLDPEKYGYEMVDKSPACVLLE